MCLCSQHEYGIDVWEYIIVQTHIARHNETFWTRRLFPMLNKLERNNGEQKLQIFFMNKYSGKLEVKSYPPPLWSGSSLLWWSQCLCGCLCFFVLMNRFLSLTVCCFLPLRVNIFQQVLSWLIPSSIWLQSQSPSLQQAYCLSLGC